METIRLGRTDLAVSRMGFGVLPLQRADMGDAVRILRMAFDAGITLYDTARGYTDSEEKIGQALSHVRDKIVIATKSGSTTRSGLLSDLETSLRNLCTDYVDVLQLHNPSSVPDPEDPESAYAGIMEAKEKGMVRFPGVSNHSLERATDFVETGLFDTLQYPLSIVSSQQDIDVVELCRKHDVGFIAMKPLSGGLITNARPAFAFLRQFENVVPIWGIQRMGELEEILEFEANPPALDEEMLACIDRDRQELAGDFCRACGYCLPCPADISIPMAARMKLLLRRMPYEQFLSEEWNEQMHRIEKCQDCGHCREHCPYGLDAPRILRKALEDYEQFYREHTR